MVVQWEKRRLLVSTVFSQLNAPGVYFKLGLINPAFIWSRRLIGARRLLKECNFLPISQIDLLLPIFETRGHFVKAGRFFSSFFLEKLSLSIQRWLLPTGTLLHCYYGLNSLCCNQDLWQTEYIYLLAWPQINAGTSNKRPRRLFKN